MRNRPYLSKKILTKSIDVADKTYKFSNKYSVENAEASLSVGSDYEVYLDEAGYAIYVVETEYNIQDYAFLRAAMSGATAFQNNEAALRDYLGKAVTVDTTRDYASGTYQISDYAAIGTEKNIGEGADGVTGTGARIVLAREAADGKLRLKALHTVNRMFSACCVQWFKDTKLKANHNR